VENVLISNLDKLHTTELGVERIKRNLRLDTEDIILWCRQQIENPQSRITRKGKNWYVRIDDCEITVNAHSYTVITAHRAEGRFTCFFNACDPL
jgi:hypothetical protein